MKVCFQLCFVLRLLFMAFLVFGTALTGIQAQEKFNASLLVAFNQGDCDRVIQETPGFIQQYPQEEGYAGYFLAECYYNKAFLELDTATARGYFRQAQEQFERAVQSADLPQLHVEYYHFARYKIGWCWFRRAELGEESIRAFGNAYSQFNTLAGDASAPDSVRLYSAYLAGESRIQESQLRLTDLITDNRQNDSPNHIFGLLTEARAALITALNYQPNDPEFSANRINKLRALARIRLDDVKYYIGKLYQLMSNNQFNLVNDPNRQGDPDATARFYFRQAYHNLPSDLPPEFSEKLSYLKMMSVLRDYFVARDDSARLAFLRGVAATEIEKEFRFANFYQTYPPDIPKFYQASPDSYRSAHAIHESTYWLAHVQMVLNHTESSRDNFRRFLDTSDNLPFLSLRNCVLRDDAQYRKFLLDFQMYFEANEVGNLQDLEQRIRDWQPCTQLFAVTKARLILLVACARRSSADDIFLEVFNQFQGAERYEEVIKTIQFLLPRAAMRTRDARLRYIDLLAKLLQLIQYTRQTEYVFYSGITQSLRAEIERTVDARADTFRQAAQTLTGILDTSRYKTESDYIRARCLFNAGDYAAARPVLTGLINQHHDIRALFYLCEILRLQNSCVPAMIGQHTIIARTANPDDFISHFLNRQARAAKELCEGQPPGGSAADLDGIEYQNVRLPDVGDDVILYEKLADRKYLTQQEADRSAKWLEKYVLPKKGFYSSSNRIQNSLLVEENVFEDVNDIINETRGPISSKLNLTIYDSDGRRINDATVRLGDDTLGATAGTYQKRGISFHSQLKLHVQHDGYFDRIVPMQFSQTEIETVLVLTERIRFGKPSKVEVSAITETRWKQNVVLRNGFPMLPQKSRLLEDFVHRYELRDCAFDPVGNRFIVVNSVQNNLWIYQNDATNTRTDQLDLANSLKSPEGIASDSERNIYITDWGNHQVAVFDSSGRFLHRFGERLEPGRRNRVGEIIKLYYPRRIAVQEDGSGLNIEGRNRKRETYVIVADRNGVHICTSAGYYLATLVSPSEQFPTGAFYDLSVVGYGRDTKLNVVVRTDIHKKSEHRPVYQFSTE